MKCSSLEGDDIRACPADVLSPHLSIAPASVLLSYCIAWLTVLLSLTVILYVLLWFTIAQSEYCISFCLTVLLYCKCLSPAVFDCLAMNIVRCLHSPHLFSVLLSCDICLSVLLSWTSHCILYNVLLSPNFSIAPASFSLFCQLILMVISSL